jgi:uncharacterized membrane protein
MRSSMILRAAVLLFSSLAFGAFGAFGALAGCGGEEDGLGECPPSSSAAEAAGHDVVIGKCQVCHSSQVSGTSRLGAPEDLNFDNLETVRAEAGEMYDEALSGSMPPDQGAKVTGADLENMRVWLACGAKETAAP